MSNRSPVMAEELDGWPAGEPSPGTLGCALLLAAGTLVPEHRIACPGAVFEGVWATECPICGARAELHGPAAGRPLGEGWLFCDACHQDPAFRDDSAEMQCMSETYYLRVEDVLHHRLTGTLGPMHETTLRKTLERAVLPQIETSRPGVETQVLGLLRIRGYSDRVPSTQEFVRLAVWLREGHRLEMPPRQLELRVIAEHRERLARAVVLEAAERLVSRSGREWFVAARLHQEEPGAMRQLADLLDCENPEFCPKSLGKLMKRMEVRSGSGEAGFERALKRGSAGQRWRVAFHWQSASA